MIILKTFTENGVVGTLTQLPTDSKKACLNYKFKNGNKIKDYDQAPNEINVLCDKAKEHCLNSGLILWSF